MDISGTIGNIHYYVRDYDSKKIYPQNKDLNPQYRSFCLFKFEQIISCYTKKESYVHTELARDPEYCYDTETHETTYKTFKYTIISPVQDRVDIKESISEYFSFLWSGPQKEEYLYLSARDREIAKINGTYRQQRKELIKKNEIIDEKNLIYKNEFDKKMNELLDDILKRLYPFVSDVPHYSFFKEETNHQFNDFVKKVYKKSLYYFELDGARLFALAKESELHTIPSDVFQWLKSCYRKHKDEI